MTKDYLEHNSGKLYYETTGAGEAIVFIHAFTLDHRMWQPQIEFFSPNYQVVTYDVRGFGKSSVPTAAYTHYDDLLALLDHLGLERAHLVGLSMGGGIASGFAILHPDRVLSLTLLDADLHGYHGTVDWNVHAKEAGIEAAKQNWLNHNVFTQTRKNTEVTSELSKMVEDYSGWHWLNQDPGSRINAKDQLNEITCPTLIVVGEKDLTYFHDVAKFMASNIPNAKLEIVAGSGHMVNMEAPEKSNTLIAHNLNNIHLNQKDEL